MRAIVNTASRYDAGDWYWQVAGENEAWSSKRHAYVKTDGTDGAYNDFTALGNKPTKIVSADELTDVLVTQQVPKILANGMQVNFRGKPDLNSRYSATPEAQHDISRIAANVAAGRGLPGRGHTFMHPDRNGVKREFGPENFMRLASALEDYTYNLQQAIAARIKRQPATIPSDTVTVG